MKIMIFFCSRGLTWRCCYNQRSKSFSSWKNNKKSNLSLTKKKSLSNKFWHLENSLWNWKSSSIKKNLFFKFRIKSLRGGFVLQNFVAHYFSVLVQNSQILAKKVPNFGKFCNLENSLWNWKSSSIKKTFQNNISTIL